MIKHLKYAVAVLVQATEQTALVTRTQYTRGQGNIDEQTDTQTNTLSHGCVHTRMHERTKTCIHTQACLSILVVTPL